ncbi:hypothetical protein BP5796_00130 [Coleophoma crateriformis]|uniref:F-box domain-containing protein n=1 Tax=Coleophoma crateriformis TaxID=565419 RepID=A0A3D8T734_9HELO|nr:hypothetical protein BP5796_00130 [Coleophoma crateriformis]
MESPRSRPIARPGSAGSNSSGRFSYESRAKSPLSIISSVDSYETGRTSLESQTSFNSSLARRGPTPVYAHGNGIPNRAPMAPMPMSAKNGLKFESTSLPPTPSRLGPQKGAVSKTGGGLAGVRYLRNLNPGEGFKKLPKEILLVILQELRRSHVEAGSLSCATCWMRDCCNLALSCKKWWRATRNILYEDIQLIGCDSVMHTKKRFKMRYGTRLTLLRRTIREQPDLADCVKTLKVPSMPEAAKTKKEREEYLDLVASVIMSCPNLERLPGFYPAYTHEFSRFVHAISTRTKLLEQVWVIDPSPFQRQHRYTLSEDSRNLYPTLIPGLLLPEQCVEFLDYHSNWDNLQTLFLHCNPGGTLDSALLMDIFASLPSLQHLNVSSFPAPAFTDDTLLSLPPLKSLRLDSVPGISASGLSTYASLPTSNTLASLSLISIPVLSLPALARLFSRLASLTAFTISQGPAPSLPMGEEIFMHPYLASSTLQSLHWETTSPLSEQATDILSKSIQFNGFPSLKMLRTPADYTGSFQALCKPRDKIELPGDRYRNIHQPLPSSQSLPNLPSPSPTKGSFFGGSNNSQASFSMPPSPAYVTSPTKSVFSFNEKEEEALSSSGGRSLAQARRQAQSRIEGADKHPQFHIIVWDDDNQFVERFAVGSFIGQVQSKIWYSLKPDIEGMDEAIVRMSTLLDGGEEVAMRNGCTGNWNLDVDKSGKGRNIGKEKWWHTERGRWKEVGLEKFF